MAGAPNPALLTGCPATIAAAQAGYAFAFFQGARCITTRDATQAADWMRAAAFAGHAGAQESAGRSCIENDPKNWPCGIEWLGRAARAGRSSAIAALGWTLANQPAADENDYRQAMNWYAQAAGAGDLSAMNNLAALYERGPEILRNPAGARRWSSWNARSDAMVRAPSAGSLRHSYTIRTPCVHPAFAPSELVHPKIVQLCQRGKMPRLYLPRSLMKAARQSGTTASPFRTPS